VKPIAVALVVAVAVVLLVETAPALASPIAGVDTFTGIVSATRSSGPFVQCTTMGVGKIDIVNANGVDSTLPAVANVSLAAGSCAGGSAKDSATMDASGAWRLSDPITGLFGSIAPNRAPNGSIESWSVSVYMRAVTDPASTLVHFSASALPETTTP
jgi:hypothetical protein